MYEAFYGLRERPFRISPDPRFLYLTPQHQEVLSKCLYMVRERVAPLYVFGPVGSGKTTIAKHLHQQLTDDTGFQVATLISPDLRSPNAFVRSIAREFGVKTERSYDETLRNLAAFLWQQHQSNIIPTLIIDEAQQLRRPLLRVLHFLLNYETTTEKLLQVVLFGQNQLPEHIDAIPELKSRMFPSALTALNYEETKDLISYRLTVAGAQRNPFTESALHEVFRLSLGLPREVCKLSDMALLAGYMEHRQEIELATISDAAKSLRIENLEANDA